MDKVNCRGVMSALRCSLCLSPQSTASKSSITEQRCFCPTHQGTGELHTSACLKVGGPEHIEEAESWELLRWCLWSWTPSPCTALWGLSLREFCSFMGGSIHNSGLSALTARVNRAAAHDYSISCHRDPWLWPHTHSGDAHEPDNSRYGRSTYDPSYHPILSLPPWQVSLRLRRPWTQWKHSPSWYSR